MTLIALVAADGSVAGQVETRGTLSAYADGSNPTKLREVVLTRRGTRLEVLNAATGTWSEVAALVEADLVASIKAESERRVMLIFTATRAKMREYAGKKQEVLDFRALTGDGPVSAVLNTAFAAISGSKKKRQYPYAQADAACRGDTIADAIARFETAMTPTDTTVANLRAIEATACAMIRAAASAADKRAWFNAINWDWKAPA